MFAVSCRIYRLQSTTSVFVVTWWVGAGSNAVWMLGKRKNLLLLPKIEQRFVCRPARSVVTILTELSRMLTNKRKLFLRASRPALGHTHPPIQRAPGINRPRLDAEHSPPSSAQVKNEWSYTSTNMLSTASQSINRHVVQRNSQHGAVSWRYELFASRDFWSLLLAKRKTATWQPHACMDRQQTANSKIGGADV